MAEPTNADRAAWAKEALTAFMSATGTDTEDAIADLIADLAHLAVELGQEPFRQVSRGLRMYMDERDYPPEGWAPVGKFAKVKIVTSRSGKPTLVYSDHALP